MTDTTQATDLAAWASVLADVAAKRAIVDEHAPRVTKYVDAPDEQSCGRCGTWHEYPVAYPCRTLRLLASAYADREGYREEWRP